MKKIFKMSMISIAFLAVMTFNIEAANTPKKGGTLRYGTVSEVSSLDPHIYVGSAWKVLIDALYSQLVSYNQNAELVPELAESWQVPDAKTLILTLRKGLVFHDGTPLTAEDVKYSLERIKSPDSGATLRPNLKDANITVVSKYVIKIENSMPDATLLSVLALPEASIISQKWMGTKPNIKVEVNGSGPFKLSNYEPSIKAVLLRNENYFIKDQPYLDRIDFRMIKDADARVNALRTGAVDMIDFVPWKDIDNLSRNPVLKVDSAGGAFMSLWYNATKKPFNDPRVRRAISFAIDRIAVSRAAFFGHGEPLFGPPTTEDSPFFNQELANSYSHDVAKSKALLAEAGIKDGFKVEIGVYQGLIIYTTTAQIIQANLKEVGIDANIKLLEWANVVESKNSGNYDFLVYGVSVKHPDPAAYSYYFSSESSYWAKPIGFKDDKLENLLTQGRTTADFTSRKKIYQEVEKRIMEICPWTFINWRETAQAYNKKVQGYKQLGGGLAEISPGIALPVLWIK